jgi:hypothetical protein
MFYGNDQISKEILSRSWEGVEKQLIVESLERWSGVHTGVWNTTQYLLCKLTI